MGRNNKGFMLVEVIVTSTIVVTTMILLYSSFNKLSNNYKTKNSYYNLDATYATKEMINSMLKSDDGNINEFINTVIHNATYGHIIKDGTCINLITLQNEKEISITPVAICENLKELYSIKNMIFLEYDEESINNLLKENINQTLKEYIEYIYKYYDIKGTETEYSYIVLTEVEEKGNYYYASLRMR